MATSPFATLKAFDFIAPAGERGRGFTENAAFGFYMEQTPKCIGKLLIEMVNLISAQEFEKRVVIRNDEALTLSEKKRRVDANREFYDHLQSSLITSQAITSKFMSNTLLVELIKETQPDEEDVEEMTLKRLNEEPAWIRDAKRSLLPPHHEPPHYAVSQTEEGEGTSTPRGLVCSHPGTTTETILADIIAFTPKLLKAYLRDDGILVAQLGRLVNFHSIWLAARLGRERSVLGVTEAGRFAYRSEILWRQLETQDVREMVREERAARLYAEERVQEGRIVNMLSIIDRTMALEYYGGWRGQQPEVVAATTDTEVPDAMRFGMSRISALSTTRRSLGEWDSEYHEARETGSGVVDGEV
ncbi:hypothetical protein P7C70_g2053, partial [Phenoliferia sp. Uapishka_3]